MKTRLLCVLLGMTLFAACSHKDTAPDNQRADRITAGVTEHKSDFAKCAKKSETGHVVVAFTVQADGKVSKTEITENTLPNPKSSACIEKAVKAITFAPEPSGDIAEIRYPIVFK